MPNRRAETAAAVGRDESPADAQMTRAIVAVAIGLVLAIWVLRPLCTNPGVGAMLPEYRVLAGIPDLVI